MTLFFLICLILASSFFSASETALFSLPSTRVRAYRMAQDKRYRLIGLLLSEPKKLLVTILIMNVCVNILIQNVISDLFQRFSSWTVTVGLPLVLTLVFGEVIPKSIAYPKNTFIAYYCASILRFIEWILKPIRDGISCVTSYVSKLFFFYLQKEKEIGIEALKVALRTSQEKGAVSTEEAKLMRGYLNLEEDVVKELMRPRSEILFYDIHAPLSDLVTLFVDKQCTRVPICNQTLENILGVMSVGSFFLHRDRFQSSRDLIPFLRKVHFVPELMGSRILLHYFYEQEERLVIVVDEYGSVSGLITREDLFEVVVGQIADRRDPTPHYIRFSDDIVIADGTLELIEFEQIFDYHLESASNMATIGGWLTEQIGDIPKSGTKIQECGFLFHVLASDVNRVRRVYIRRIRSKKRKNDG